MKRTLNYQYLCKAIKLFVFWLLVLSVCPANAQMTDTELLKTLNKIQGVPNVNNSSSQTFIGGSKGSLEAGSSTGNVVGSQLENVDKSTQKNTNENQQVVPPSRVEQYFTLPAPELGAPFRNNTLIDNDLGKDQAIGKDRSIGKDQAIDKERSVGKEQALDESQSMGNELIVPDVERSLKQFGYDFFTNPKGAYVPDELAPVGPDYVVGPGDHLQVSIWGSIEGNYETVVGRNGQIVLPKIGTISVWGQTFDNAEATIREHIAKYYTGFDLSVTLAGIRSIQVFLVGEVNSPGTYSVSSLSTILTALVESGGPAKTGSLRNIQLRRSGKLIDTVDFYNFLLNGDTSHDHALQSGDTIVVPVVGPLVGVAGDVRRPAIYELKPGEVLQDALNLAGGLNTTAFISKIQIERVDSHSKRFIQDVDINEGDALSIPMHDQDLVKVPSISMIPSSYVRLAGYVSRPGQYQFVTGMRVADLILPYDNLLPMYYPKMAEVLRFDPPEYRPKKLTIDLSLALAGDPVNNIKLQEFDEVHIFSRDEMEEIPEVQISGAVKNPGVYRLFDGMTVRDLVVASGNLLEDAYLDDAELTQFFEMGKETRVERLNIELGKAMHGDPLQNLNLRSGDHLLVRSIPDFHRNDTVQVEGKVLFPGTYSIIKGERLSSVLERAGGFSRGAYLRGAVFTRKSVEDLVRERMERLIAQEEAAIIQLSNELSQGAFNEADTTAAQNLLESRKAIVSRLKNIPLLGRMVVRLEPIDVLRGSEFDIELMAGDKISIPEIPSSVSVLGEVFNSTSILYKPGNTASFYLSMVGGPRANANEDEMFIVRADGSVYSKKQGGGSFMWDETQNRWFSGGFANVELYPGDTILVPQEFKQTDWLREIKDVTLIMYQMALGAAAVASF